MSEDFPGRLAGFAAGSQVAGYVLEEQVGAGGMAVVFRARDERLGRLVALKLLAPVLAADEAFRQRFIRESRSAAAVDDPHIIPVHEAGEASGVLFLAMRYVPGGDVRSLLHREGPLPPARAAAIISPVASALDAAHAAGLVHRDVKPGNMLLDARPGRPDHVYLSDFGLSKGVLSSIGVTGSGQFVGSPDYSAPEQIEGRAVDGRTDQYALACSAFELLAGAPPFHRDQGLAVIYAHLSAPPPSLAARRPDLPPAVDQVFAKALAKTPEDRYASCREFADALRGALNLVPYHSDPGAIPAAGQPVTEIALPAAPGAAEQGTAVATSRGDAEDARGAQQSTTPAIQREIMRSRHEAVPARASQPAPSAVPPRTTAAAALTGPPATEPHSGPLPHADAGDEPTATSRRELGTPRSSGAYARHRRRVRLASVSAAAISVLAAVAIAIIAVARSGSTPHPVSSGTQSSSSTSSVGRPHRTGFARPTTISVGSKPFDIAITPNGKKAYVLGFNGTVTPIDFATGTPGTAVFVASLADDIAITPNSKTAYVMSSSGTVRPLNTATGALGTPIRVGGTPTGIAITPNGKTVYVANAVGTVTPINVATGKTGSPILVGGILHSIAITPNGKTIYVGNADFLVTPIDVATGTLGTPIRFGGENDEILITPNGKTAYVRTSYPPEIITPINLATGIVGASITFRNLITFAITPDGKTAYVIASGKVIPVNLATGTKGTPIKVGNSPYAIAITPDGKTAYVTNSGADTVTPISLPAG